MTEEDLRKQLNAALKSIVSIHDSWKYRQEWFVSHKNEIGRIRDFVKKYDEETLYDLAQIRFDRDSPFSHVYDRYDFVRFIEFYFLYPYGHYIATDIFDESFFGSPQAFAELAESLDFDEKLGVFFSLIAMALRWEDSFVDMETCLRGMFYLLLSIQADRANGDVAQLGAESVRDSLIDLSAFEFDSLIWLFLSLQLSTYWATDGFELVHSRFKDLTTHFDVFARRLVQDHGESLSSKTKHFFQETSKFSVLLRGLEDSDDSVGITRERVFAEFEANYTLDENLNRYLMCLSVPSAKRPRSGVKSSHELITEILTMKVTPIAISDFTDALFACSTDKCKETFRSHARELAIKYQNGNLADARPLTYDIQRAFPELVEVDVNRHLEALKLFGKAEFVELYRSVPPSTGPMVFLEMEIGHRLKCVELRMKSLLAMFQVAGFGNKIERQEAFWNESGERLVVWNKAKSLMSDERKASPSLRRGIDAAFPFEYLYFSELWWCLSGEIVVRKLNGDKGTKTKFSSIFRPIDKVLKRKAYTYTDLGNFICDLRNSWAHGRGLSGDPDTIRGKLREFEDLIGELDEAVRTTRK
ncbi:hypothetical protein HUU59_13235 [bacterium]|nr:hypothetical protein [bacterium]